MDEQSRKHYKCSFCGKCFSQNIDLLRHKVIHNDEAKFKCSVCGKAFSRNSAVMRHMSVHTGNWKFKCDVCGKGCNDNSSLQRHMAAHTGEKRYQCVLCGKSVFHKSELRRHMSAHQEQKKYKCQYCGEVFFQKPDLMTHMNIHLQHTSLECAVCGKMFSNKTTFFVHMAIHSKEKKNFQCSECGLCTETQSHSPELISVNSSICGVCKDQDQNYLPSDKKSNALTNNHYVKHIEVSRDYNGNGAQKHDDNQLQENHAKSASALKSVTCSVSDDNPSRTENEILGLDSEYDGIGVADPVDDIGHTPCVFIKKETGDSGVDDKEIKKFVHYIKIESEDDLHKNENDSIIKEETFEGY